MLLFQNRALVAILAIALCTSCEVLDPAEPAAAYISIDDIDVNILIPGEEGSASHKITDAWVYANGELVGAFELPAVVPILEEGPTEIIVFAGIKNGGFSSDRKRYPFYEPYKATLDLVPDEVIALDFDVNYYDATDVYVIDDFESAGTNFIAGPISDTNFTSISTAGYVFEGSGSGEAHMVTGMTYWESRSNEDLVLPQGDEIYLEMDYATNDTVLVGIIAENILGSTKSGVIYLFPTYSGSGFPVYNKIYIQLSNQIGTAQNADTFEIYFERLLSGSHPQEPRYYIDNVKICY